VIEDVPSVIENQMSLAHISLSDYEEIIRQAQSLHVFQVALGGGNPNQHPQFPEILRLTREKYGIVPNYTTNVRGRTPLVIEATAKYCGAVAVGEKMEVYPCSFMVKAGYRRIPLKGSSLGEIWRNHGSFRGIRTKHGKKGCVDCTTPRQCLSGCPLFPEVSLCPKNCNSAEAHLLRII
jgi:radical SAM protein with 4Fe4S-binding SPASM domain